MTQITRVPFGFTDLLGSKNFGKNPTELSGVVAPIVDIGEFLAVERRSFTHNAPTVQSADGVATSMSVPEGELWLIESCAVQVTAGGASGNYYCDFGAAVTQVAGSSSGGQIHGVADLGTFVDNGNATAGAGLWIGSYDFPNRLPLFSDEVLQFYIKNGDYSAGRQYTVGATCRYLKLNV